MNAKERRTRLWRRRCQIVLARRAVYKRWGVRCEHPFVRKSALGFWCEYCWMTFWDLPLNPHAKVEMTHS